jgi:hypothetical protein
MNGEYDNEELDELVQLVKELKAAGKDWKKAAMILFAGHEKELEKAITRF